MKCTSDKGVYFLSKNAKLAHTFSDGKIAKSLSLCQGKMRIVTRKKIYDDCGYACVLFDYVDYAVCFLVDADYRETSDRHRKTLRVARIRVGEGSVGIRTKGSGGRDGRGVGVAPDNHAVFVHKSVLPNAAQRGNRLRRAPQKTRLKNPCGGAYLAPLRVGLGNGVFACLRAWLVRTFPMVPKGGRIGNRLYFIGGVGVFSCTVAQRLCLPVQAQMAVVFIGNVYHGGVVGDCGVRIFVVSQNWKFKKALRCAKHDYRFFTVAIRNDDRVYCGRNFE